MGKGDKSSSDKGSSNDKGSFKGQLGQSQFISFSDVSSSSSSSILQFQSSSTSSSSSPFLAPLYQGDDSDLAIASKRLLKKDSNTRLKAIKEIEMKLSNENTSSLILSSFLPFFTYSYQRLTLDDDRKVREQLQKALLAIIILEKRSLQDYMKLLIGPWWVSTADSCIEVAKASIEAFEKAIPPKKRQSVLMLLSPYILKHMQKNLTQTPEKLCNPESLGQKISPICTKDEADECYERIIVSTVSSIGRLMSVLDNTENEKLILGVSDDSNEQYDAIIGYRDIISENFWDMLMNSQESIRKAMYELLLVVCKRAPALIDVGNLRRMAHIVIKFLGETYEPNLVLMYESVLTFIRTYPDCWLYIDVPQNLIPKLRKQINLFPSISMQFLMPILGSIPSNEFSIHAGIIEKDPYKKKNKKTKEQNVTVDNNIEQKSTVVTVIELTDYLIEINENETLSPEQMITIDINICEILMMMLLRKSCEQNPTDSNSLARTVASKLISSTIMIIKGSCKKLDDYSNNFESLLKVLIQLTRGTQKAINFSVDSWVQYLWIPLSESIQNLLSIDNYHDDFNSNFKCHSTYVKSIFRLLDACYDNTNNGTGFDIVISDLINKTMKRIEAIDTSFNENTIDNGYALAMNINILLIIVTEYPKLFSNLAKMDIGRIHSILSGPYLENIVCSMKYEESSTLCDYTIRICQYINSNVVVKVHQLQSPLIDTLISYSMKAYSLKFLYVLFESGILKGYVWNGVYLSFISGIMEFIINSGHGDNDVAKQCYKDSDHETNLLLVIQYFFSSSIELQEALLTKVYETWKQKGFKICLWIMLSIFVGNESMSTSTMPIAINLNELLVSAFFNRNREQIRQQRQGPVIQKMPKAFKAVSSWNEIRSHLFPRLDTSVAEDFANFIISELAIHSGSSNSGAVVDDDTDADNQNSETNLKSRKWARHVCGLLSLAEDRLLGGLSFRSVVHLLGLGDIDVWRNACNSIIDNGNGSFEQVAFIMNCVLQIQDLWKDANLEHKKLDWLGVSDNSLLHITILKCIYICKENGVPSSSMYQISNDCWQLCTNAIVDNNKIDIAVFVGTLLNNSLSDRSELLGCTIDVLSYCLDRSVKTLESDDVTRIVLETPGDIIDRGTKIWYIQRNSNDDIFEYDTVPCTLQSTHKQAGIETYYTITIDNIFGRKEIQTEASRLLLLQVSSSSSSSSDVYTYTSINVSRNPIQIEIENWLLSMMKIVEVETNGSGYNSSSRNTLSLLSQLLVVVGKHADKSGETAMWKSLFSKYRQEITKQLVKIQSVSRLELTMFTQYVPVLSVINALVQSTTGLGEVVWLVTSLYSFSSKLRLLRLDSSCLRNNDFSQLIYFYSIIMLKINWYHYKNAAVNILGQVLVLLKQDVELKEIPLNQSKLKQAYLNCINSVFLERGDRLKQQQSSKKQLINPGLAALQRIEKEAELQVSAWEFDALEFVVSELLHYEVKATEDDRNKYKYDNLIASSLHYIMLERPRQAASELLNNTKVSITVSDLLDVVRNREASPTIRLAAAKLLDVHYTSPVQDLEVITAESEVNEEDEDDETDFISDTELFKKFVGETFIEKLTNDWKSNKKHGDDTIGCLLTWLLCLQRIDTIATQKWDNRSRLGNYLRRSGVFGSVLNFLLKFVPDLLKFKDLPGTLNRVYEISTNAREDETMQQIASYALYRSVVTLPAMTRFWWSNESSQGNKQKASKFIEERVRLSIAKREVELMAIASATGRWDSNEFSVKGFAASGEITAVMIKDDTKIEMKVKLPPSYPLKNVEVECNTKIGIPESRWKRWTLQIIQLLAQQDGAVIDAVLFWKKNVERELEGLEPCPICYSIIHVKDASLPSLKCQTCSNKFHSSCLYQWFKSSGKNKCVICQQPFTGGGSPRG